MSPRVSVLVLAVVCALACSSRDDPESAMDAAAGRDAGTSSDAGSTTDAPSPPDTGTVADASTPTDAPAPLDAPAPIDAFVRDARPPAADASACLCPNSGTCMDEGEILCAPAPDYPCAAMDGWYAECTATGWMCRFTTPAIC
jgi:hypothetical protein